MRNNYLNILEPNRRIVKISELDTEWYEKLKPLSRQSFEDLDRWLATQFHIKDELNTSDQSELSRYLHLVHIFQESYKAIQDTHLVFNMHEEYQRGIWFRWIAIDPRLSMQDEFVVDSKWHTDSTVIWGWHINMWIG